MANNKEIIPEETISLDDVKEVGGLAHLRVEDIDEPFLAKVVSATARKTQWGNRVDYEIEGEDGFGHIMSSWIFMSRVKINPKEILGKNIRLKPYNEKKLLLEVI